MSKSKNTNTKKIVLSVLSGFLILVLIALILTATFFGKILLRKNVVEPYAMSSTLTAPVDAHTDLQSQFLNEKFYWRIAPYADGTKELSRPNPIHISWATILPTTGYTVRFSEYEDMRDSLVYPIGEDGKADVYNLKVGTNYYCAIYSPLGTSLDTTAQKQLTTENRPPRNMYVDGVTNVRDLGGWSIGNGKRVKQGLLYRCGRLNENKTETPVAKITEKGIETMRTQMKIKSELDLRKTSDNEIGGLTGSLLGDDVNYFSCPMGYENNMLTTNTEMVKRIFSDILSKRENYPLIFHCSIGTDRTGMIAFLVNGLLGVDINDLYRDYLFSNFGNIGGDRDIIGITFHYVATIQNTKGGTLSEKIENYLLSIGVKQEEIDSIRTILSE